MTDFTLILLTSCYNRAHNSDEKIADKELNCCFCADHSEHYGGTAEQAAEKRLRDKSLPQRLKPSIRNAFAALKGRSSTVLQACASLSAVR